MRSAEILHQSTLEALTQPLDLTRVLAIGIELAEALAKMHEVREVQGDVGAPAYRAPELLTASARPTARSDQYGLACVLFQIIVDPPHLGPRIDWSRFPSDPRFALLRAILELMTAADPADRFVDMRAVARALKSVLSASAKPDAIAENDFAFSDDSLPWCDAELIEDGTCFEPAETPITTRLERHEPWLAADLGAPAGLKNAIREEDDKTAETELVERKNDLLMMRMFARDKRDEYFRGPPPLVTKTRR